MSSVIKGTENGSEIYFHTPSEYAKNNLYYPVSAGHFYCNGDYEVNRENYGNNILVMYIKSGECHIETENLNASAKGGDTAVIDCNKPHKYYCRDSAESYWFHFTGLNSERLISTNIINADEKIKDSVCEIIDNIKAPESTDEVLLSFLIYKTIYLLLTADGTYKNASKTINLAKSYILENMDKNISVNDIASYVYLSPSYFSRLFKNQTGFSPYDYIISARLDKAKYLLKSTGKSVSEIAYEIGFNSEANFIYTFTKHNGISPGKFRKINF